MNIGDAVAGLALMHGADDLDGTVGHEEIMHAAGSDTSVDDDEQQLGRLISKSGGIAVRRDSIYTRFRRLDRDDGLGRPISLPMTS
jgi:2-iminoacetate synthase ThiH